MQEKNFSLAQNKLKGTWKFCIIQCRRLKRFKIKINFTITNHEHFVQFFLINPAENIIISRLSKKVKPDFDFVQIFNENGEK